MFDKDELIDLTLMYEEDSKILDITAFNDGVVLLVKEGGETGKKFQALQFTDLGEEEGIALHSGYTADCRYYMGEMWRDYWQAWNSEYHDFLY